MADAPLRTKANYVDYRDGWRTARVSRIGSKPAVCRSSFADPSRRRSATLARPRRGNHRLHSIAGNVFSAWRSMRSYTKILTLAGMSAWIRPERLCRVPLACGGCASRPSRSGTTVFIAKFAGDIAVGTRPHYRSPCRVAIDATRPLKLAFTPCSRATPVTEAPGAVAPSSVRGFPAGVCLARR